MSCSIQGAESGCLRLTIELYLGRCGKRDGGDLGRKQKDTRLRPTVDNRLWTTLSARHQHEQYQGERHPSGLLARF